VGSYYKFEHTPSISSCNKFPLGVRRGGGMAGYFRKGGGTVGRVVRRITPTIVRATSQN
jgi:hypothetical protein